MCITQQWLAQLHRLRRRAGVSTAGFALWCPTTQAASPCQTLARRDDITKLARQAGHSFQCTEPAHHFR